MVERLVKNERVNIWKESVVVLVIAWVYTSKLLVHRLRFVVSYVGVSQMLNNSAH